MHAAAIRVELRIRETRTLKQKRSTVKSLIADLRRTFEVSVAEVDHQDLWHRTTLGVAVVAPQGGHLERVIILVERFLDNRDDVELLATAVGHIEMQQ